MKPITFLGDSLDCIRSFPVEPKSTIGFQLSEIPAGYEPVDWKPMKRVGTGVRELRGREASGSFRVIYLAMLPDRILVLHAFQKKTQQTPSHAIDLAARRLREWKG